MFPLDYAARCLLVQFARVDGPSAVTVEGAHGYYAMARDPARVSAWAPLVLVLRTPPRSLAALDTWARAIVAAWLEEFVHG